MQEFYRAPEQFLGTKKVKIEGNTTSQLHVALVQDPKWEALNLQERQLCTTLHLRPTTYLDLKRSLTME
jgi:hypothetical protein